jgi:hypothetical protein
MVDFFEQNANQFQFLGNGRYNHYEIIVDDEDADEGSHLIVEISNVRDGALFVYFNSNEPGDEAAQCHIANLCTSGLGAGSSCSWQVPFCLTKPGTHYVSVEGVTGRTSVTYDILFYFQTSSDAPSNPQFDYENIDLLGNDGLEITHQVNWEPNNWAQFIRLPNVSPNDLATGGDILEVFFYNIRNQVAEPLAFNVYLYPDRPAGAHQCCTDDDATPSDIGNCLGAPCLRTVELTTWSSLNGGSTLSNNNLCDLGFGIGNDFTNDTDFNDIILNSRCTVTVWPCEFSEFQGDESTRDWWLTVIPVAANNPNSEELRGLEYNVQFRTRTIRTFENATEAVLISTGTTDLTEFINLESTPDYVVTNYDIDSRNYASFSFEVSSSTTSTRVSVQTNFESGSGEVYINTGEFASPFENCNEYHCATSDGIDCNGSGRYVQSQCCFTGGRYYITVVNNVNPFFDNVNNVTTATNTVFNFRIVVLNEPAVVDETLPFTASGNPTAEGIFPNFGVEFENYQFYRFDVSETSLLNYQSIWVNFTKDNDFNNETLIIYFHPDHRGGDYYGSNRDFYNNPEGCYFAKFECQVTGGEYCMWQIPPCVLREATYYISVYNPQFDFTGGFNFYQDFDLSVWQADPPQSLALGVSTSGSLNGVIDNYYHYSLTLSAADLLIGGTSLDSSFYNQWLRFELQNVTGSGNVNIYGNYEVLSGDSDDWVCYGDYFSANECNLNDACAIDIAPCALELLSGTYYFSVRVFSDSRSVLVNADWNVIADLHQENYEFLVATSNPGTGHRSGTNNVYYRYETQPFDGIFDSLPNGGTDGEGNYRFSFEILGISSNDIFLGNDEYVIFNITANDVDFIGSGLDLTVWRDDCQQWTCSVDSIEGWCTIDAVGLSTCTARGGRYYAEIQNPSNLNFTFEVFHNQATIQTLVNEQIITEITYPYEYQHYYFEPVVPTEFSTLQIAISAYCGGVEAWVSMDVPSGPGPQVNGDSCNINHCYTEEDNIVINGDLIGRYCDMYLDTCIFEQRGYWITVRGVDQTYPNDSNPNLYLPITYDIYVDQTNIELVQFSGTSCAKTVGYTNFPSSSGTPRQYYFDLETINIGASMKISVRVPDEIYVDADPFSSEQGSITMMKDWAVGYNDNTCDFNSLYSCSVSGYGSSCSFEVQECSDVGTGRYYIWADVPRGSEVLVELFEPTIPILVTDRVYSASINTPSVGNLDFDLPYRPNRQFYRIDVEPDNTDFYMKVKVWNVEQGSLNVIVNSGNAPSYSGDNENNDASYCLPQGSLDYLNDFTCKSVDSNNPCMIEISRCEIRDDTKVDADRLRTFWITIEGNSLIENCDLHSVKYDLQVETLQDFDTLQVGTKQCYTVTEGEHHFFRLSPRSVERPQLSILNFEIVDVKHETGEEVELLLYDANGALATIDCFDQKVRTGLDGQAQLSYTSGYNELFVSVYGISADHTASDPTSIEYCLGVEREIVRVVALQDSVIHFEDDDDVDVCDHDQDYYFFRVTDNDDDGDHFIIEVRSEAPFRGFLNHVHFANEQNHIDYCEGSQFFANDGDMTYYCKLVALCDFNEEDYFITIESEGKYSIGAAQVNNLIELEQNIGLEGATAQLEIDTFFFDVTSEMIFDSSTRLIGELSDVRHGGVLFLVNRGSMAGLEFFSDGSIDTCFDDVVYVSGESTQESFLVIDPCDLRPGRYYFTIIGLFNDENLDDFQSCKETRYTLTVSLESINIPVQSIPANTPTSDSLYFYSIDRLQNPEARFYSVSLAGGDNSFSFANFRLQNVQGGNLKMLINDQIALPTFTYYQGNTFRVSRSSNFFNSQDEENVSGLDIFGRYDNIKLRTTNQYTSDCDASCASHCCSTSDLTLWDQSCMVMVSPCDFEGAQTYYIAIETLSQDNYGESINFEVAIDQYDDYDEIDSNTNKIGHFTDGNFDQHYYVGRTSHQQSVRFRVQVINGDGVSVVVRDSNCPEDAQWEQEIYCDAKWINRAWQCDIEVPTRAAHPGAHVNNFYVSVSGNNATYSIGYFSGRENCEQFSGSGISDGLRFCENIVSYSTFRHEKYFLLDDAARCLFEELYDHFRVSDCFSGVTPSCNQTLARFACYEHFHRCDNDGFYVGTCRKACDAVVRECSNHFETVDLEHFNCTSSRYLDDRYETCTGHHEQYEYSGDRLLGERVDDILFKSSPMTKTFTDVSTTALGSSVASTTSLSIFTIFFSVVFFFLM